jgi:hypothetical protein
MNMRIKVSQLKSIIQEAKKETIASRLKASNSFPSDPRGMIADRAVASWRSIKDDLEDDPATHGKDSAGLIFGGLSRSTIETFYNSDWIPYIKDVAKKNKLNHTNLVEFVDGAMTEAIAAKEESNRLTKSGTKYKKSKSSSFDKGGGFASAAVKAWEDAETMYAGRESDSGAEYSDDIFRPRPHAAIRQFADADWESYMEQVAKKNKIDPEGFVYFVQCALDAELDRISDSTEEDDF